MKLYKDGQEILADKSQLRILLEAGWSQNPDGPKETASEDNIVEDDVDIVKIEKPKKKKTKKIAVKG